MSKRQRSIGNLVVCETAETLTSEADEIRDRIRQRAFEISLDRGHAGRELEDWLSAESELLMSPPAEVSEKDGSFLIRMAAVGIDVKDLRVFATSDQALVKAEFRHEHEPGAKIHSCDFRSAMLFRSIRFPASIDLATLKIELKAGMLLVTARRADVEKPRKTAKRSAKRTKRGA